MLDVLAEPFTVDGPALAVIEPRATSFMLTVMADVLPKPFIVNGPALVVIDLTTTSEVARCARHRIRDTGTEGRTGNVGNALPCV